MRPTAGLRIVESNANGVLDVPRRGDGSAILGDGRNDENLIVVQLHIAFLRFHNRLIDDYDLSFADAQRLTRYHYQWIVLHEYLPDIVGRRLSTGSLPARTSSTSPETSTIRCFRSSSRWRPSALVTARSARATRSTARPGGRPSPPSGPDLRGGRPIPPGHEIEWQRFFEFDRATSDAPGEQADRHQDQPGTVQPSDSRRRCRRIERLGLPQHDARQVLRPPERASRRPRDGRARAYGEPPGRTERFENATPLWYYILLESEKCAGGERLGPVGARIVTEVFLTNLRRDPGSYLNARPGFQPSVPHEDPSSPWATSCTSRPGPERSPPRGGFRPHTTITRGRRR